eukprot:a5599_30.p1 GENE.a5599_30~~a5599_30.p1  ORF type:complete len:226 (+),score=80.15 a5599_30:29-679(+)
MSKRSAEQSAEQSPAKKAKSLEAAVAAADAADAAQEWREVGANAGGAADDDGVAADQAPADASGDLPFGPPHNGQTNLYYEYRDHTADIQLHAWGYDLAMTFENTALAMFDYMVELPAMAIKETRRIEAKAHDLNSLLFAFMDEWLYMFNTEMFVAKQIFISAFDRENFVIRAEGRGEIFDKTVHPAGTEVKAITFSEMQIHETDTRCDIYIIVDI